MHISDRQLDICRKQGFLIVGNFNQAPYDAARAT